MKGFGYLLSAASVLLLGTVAWDGIAENGFLRLCLLGGMATSIVGMGLRYWAYRREQG